MVKDLITFVGGVATGGLVAYLYLKRKYESIIEEEIEAVRNFYDSEYFDEEEPIEESIPEEEEEEKESEVKYAELVSDYTSYSKPDLKTLAANEDSKEGPYIIEPEEFGEVDGYETINLTYYADGYLTDDMDELVDNVDEVIGWSNLNEMGKYEEDALHIRNEKLKVDYEILQVMEKFKDIEEVD